MDIEIKITPKDESLRLLDVSHEAFDAALQRALDSLDDNSDLLDPEDIVIHLQGREYRLGDVAIVTVTPDAEASKLLSDEKEDGSGHPA